MMEHMGAHGCRTVNLRHQKVTTVIIIIIGYSSYHQGLFQLALTGPVRAILVPEYRNSKERQTGQEQTKHVARKEETPARRSSTLQQQTSPSIPHSCLETPPSSSPFPSRRDTPRPRRLSYPRTRSGCSGSPPSTARQAGRSQRPVEVGSK